MPTCFNVFSEAQAFLTISVLGNGRLSRCIIPIYVSNSVWRRKSLVVKTKAGWPKAVLIHGKIEFENVIEQLQRDVFPRNDEKRFLLAIQVDRQGKRKSWINSEVTEMIEDLELLRQSLNELKRLRENGGSLGAIRFWEDLRRMMELSLGESFGATFETEQVYDTLKREVAHFEKGFSIWH